jgi:uncharacterized membrane protein
MVSEKFRRQLRQEAEQWWKDGLIDAALYEQLANRYQLHHLEQDASNRFIAILMGLGSILLGLAAITFVAANWQVWSRPVKVLLLLSLFLVVNLAGFYLWRRPAPLKGQQRLGHGLLLLGALLLGANLSLLSQMFHQSGNFYELFLIWGIGVIAMAYSLRLTSLGVLAWILITIGYLSGWISRSFTEELSLGQGLIQHMPLVASGLLIPLAYVCRSKVIFALGGFLVAASLCLNFVFLWHSIALPVGWTVAIAFALPPALLWSYSSRIWRSARTIDPFQPIARHLALCCLAITCYTLAFRPWWEPIVPDFVQRPWAWQPLIDGVILLGITGLGWLQLRHDWPRGRWFQERALHSGTVGVLILITAGSLIWNFDVQPLEAMGVLLFNIMLFLLAVGLIRDGLALGNRGTFWGGMVLLVLGIISRMLEYNTGLLLKSIAFALCGAGIIVAGLWFERKVHLNAGRNRINLDREHS